MTNPYHYFPTHRHRLNPRQIGPYLDHFATELATKGYTPLTIGDYLASIAHFGEWAQSAGIAVETISDESIAAFATHQCECLGARKHERVSRKYVARVTRFVHYLRQQGVVSAVEKPLCCTHQPSCAQFRHWLHQHRGLSPRTIEAYEYVISRLQPLLGSDMTQCNAATVRRVVLAETGRYSRAYAKRIVTALRAYLRFLAAKGLCHSCLVQAVPKVAQWKLSALPRYLVADDVERVLASCDLNTLLGVRDHAILLLLARLGLRGGDIVTLSLNDIDWQEGTLRVRGKGRREFRLPLPQDVGDALLVYLETWRPQVAIGRAFLCVNAPYRPFATSTSVSNIVRFALCRAGIVNPPSRGAHLLRHSAATSMLRAGATLDAIATVLRHRSSDTTAHYAKVDIVMLRQVAQPWPEDAPC